MISLLAGRRRTVRSARLVLIVSSLLAAVSNVVPQAKPVKQKAEDPTVHTVKFLLDQQSTGFSDARLEGDAERLGDQVGTALLKIFSATELEDPENIRRFLPIIRPAFQFPNVIATSHRKPNVTLPLLARLERRVSDADLKREISAVAEFLKRQTLPKR